jgi:hypothetical protein
MLPFSTEQFFAVFAAYNMAIWPAQVIAYALGVLAIGLVGRSATQSNRLIAGTLSVGWLWTGVVYHWIFFSTVNPIARAFAVGFAIQAALIFVAGVVRQQLVFAWRQSVSAILGVFLITYAMVLYPALGAWMGHGYPKTPTFGVTPCSLTIFTFGLLLLTGCRVPKAVLMISFAWSLIGGSAAVLLQVPQDWMLLVAGSAGTALIWARDAAGRRSHAAVDSVQPTAETPTGL